MEISTLQIDARNWLFRESVLQIAAAIQALTGEALLVENSPVEDRPGDQGLIWRQPFSDISGSIWIVSADESWRGIGASVLRAGGVDESADQFRSEYLEIVRQAVSAVASAAAARFGREVTPGIGEQVLAIGEAQWGQIEITISGGLVNVAIGIEPELLAALTVSETRDLPSPAGSITGVPANSRTFELLLDLELPVSISFGRAQVLLKDVLKLTVGSIVELNRAVGDPVEVIVNNCVIAKGQVVVVEGNFGVRIQNVISTQERLRSLD
jgi:flagellar motor switch protein FliN/FliY